MDAPRSGAPRSIGDAAVERPVVLTLEKAASDATHWRTRSMARHAGNPAGKLAPSPDQKTGTGSSLSLVGVGP